MTPSDGASRPADPELLLRDQRWLVALAKSLVGDADAEDVVQEARLRAWLHAPSDSARSGGWLRRITRNVALRMRRRDASRAARERAGAPGESLPPTDELVARVQMQRAVADAVLALAEPYRSAVLLRFFDRLPPRDIATRLDLPVETVRTRLKRALEQLRARLDHEYGARDAWAALLLPWTTVATATTKVGVKVAVAAVLIGTAGVTTWEGVKAKRVRASEGGAQVAAASASGATALRGAGEGDGGSSASSTVAARSEDSTLASRGHIHLTARIVDAATREPIAGARVRARPWMAKESDDASALADVDGRVILDFGTLQNTHFELFVTHVDHAQLERSVNLDDPGDHADGEPRGAHDFGDLALERGDRVAGRVVRGRERTPVPDAKLLLLRNGYFTGFWLCGCELAGETRPDGSFELGERIGNRGSSPILYAVTPTGLGWIAPTIVNGRDRIEGVEITIDEPARVDVRVVDENGAPIPGTRVLALPRFSPLGPTSFRPLEWDFFDPKPGVWSSMFESITDADGCVSLPFLPVGRDDELLQRGGGNPRTYTFKGFTPIQGRRTAIATVALAPGERTDLKLEARSLVPLTIRGHVTDDGGSPIVDARILRSESGRATTDGKGFYELPPFAVDRDRVHINVSADGFSDVEQDLLDSEFRPRIVPVRDEDGAVTREEFTVDFVLPSRRTVRGRCIDATGDGVPNVQVELAQHDEWRTTSSLRTGRTGVDGRFEIDGLKPGDATLMITPPREYRSVTRRVVDAGAEDIEVRLVAKAPNRARLVVEVVDAGTEQPADVAKALLHPEALGCFSQSCACAVGSVKADGLGTGRWWITVVTANGARARRDFQVVNPDDEVHLRLEVAPAPSIEGHITRPDGAPFPAHCAIVFVRAGSNFAIDGGRPVDAEGRTKTDTTDCCTSVDADGIFRVADLTPGMPLRLFTLDPDAISESVVILEPGEKRHVEMVTSPGAELSFRFARRMTPGRFRLEVAREDGRFGLIAQDDSVRDGGVWDKGWFAPGKLRWRVTHASEEDDIPVPCTVEGELDVVAGQPQTVEIRGLK